MNDKLICSTFMDISSYQWEFFYLTDLIILITSLVDKNLILIFGKGFAKLCDRQWMGVVVGKWLMLTLLCVFFAFLLSTTDKK
jgi:hypothetical protein